MKLERHIIIFEKNKDEIFYVRHYIPQREQFLTAELVPFQDLDDDNGPSLFTTGPQAQRAIDDIGPKTTLDCKATGLREEEILPNLKPRQLVFQLI